ILQRRVQRLHLPPPATSLHLRPPGNPSHHHPPPRPPYGGRGGIQPTSPLIATAGRRKDLSLSPRQALVAGPPSPVTRHHIQVSVLPTKWGGGCAAKRR